MSVMSVFLPLPVERIWGVGAKAAQQLRHLGCRTVTENQASQRLADLDQAKDRLQERFGAGQVRRASLLKARLEDEEA